MDKQMILKPRLSEKSYGLSLVNNTYTFEVPGDATKHTVARAITAQFNVAVAEVNIVNVKGKPKRTVRKGGRPTNGKRPDVKKAYVTLKEGESLPIFDVPEEGDKKADKKKETK
jgi:large subunit ribosomal protein L23